MRTVAETKSRTLRFKQLIESDWQSTPLSSAIHSEMANTVQFTNQVTYGPDIPSYQQRIADCLGATTSLSGTKTVRVVRPLHYRHTGTRPGLLDVRTSYGQNINGLNVANPPSVGVSEAQYKAASSLLKSYTAATNSFRGGNFLAELAETLRMLKNPIKSLYDHTWTFTNEVRKARKVYRRDPVRYGKLLGSLWLGYSFGAKPLADDIVDAARAVDLLTHSQRSFDVARIKGFGSSENLQSQGVFNVPLCPYARTYGSARILTSVAYKGAIRLEPSSGWSYIADELGLSIPDVLPAVWEAVPWSFLVDYFVNVGEVLDSIRYLGARPRWLQRTERRTRHFIVSDLWPAESSGYEVVCSGGRYSTHTTVVTRLPVGEFPFPGFNLRVPGFGTKWLNIAALANVIAASKPTT